MSGLPENRFSKTSVSLSATFSWSSPATANAAANVSCRRALSDVRPLVESDAGESGDVSEHCLLSAMRYDLEGFNQLAGDCRNDEHIWLQQRKIGQILRERDRAVSQLVLRLG
jgi:hypothetical protein